MNSTGPCHTIFLYKIIKEVSMLQTSLLPKLNETVHQTAMKMISMNYDRFFSFEYFSKLPPETISETRTL